MSRTLIRGARLFADPQGDAQDILLEDGKIAAIGQAGKLDAGGGDIHDADGLLAMPGLIDVHVHPIHDETFASVGNAAVHAGITTVLNHLYPAPDESFREALARMSEDAGQGLADFGAHVRWDRSRHGEDLAELARDGGLSVKVFLAHPDKDIQANLDDLVTAMRQSADAGIPTLVHSELGSVVDRVLEEGLGDRHTLASIHHWRSTHNEAATITAAASIARTTGAHLYVVHVSCQEAMDACERARRDGVHISVETCPHYLFLTHEEAPPGGQGFVLPPLRTSADVAAIRSAIVRGLVDTVGSDHCGYCADAKRPHDVAGSKAGLPGIETLSRLLIDAAIGKDAWLPANRVLQVLSEGPARAFQLKGKGALVPGYDADVTLIDPAGTTVISHARLHDAAEYSPYEGRKLQGVIQQVWRRGTLVLDGGNTDGKGGGQLVGSHQFEGTASRRPSVASLGTL